MLAQEVAAGRVVETPDGGYALVVTCSSPDAISGLRWLSGARPSDVDGDRVKPQPEQVAAALAIVGTEDAA